MRCVDECVRLIKSVRHIADARNVHSQVLQSRFMSTDGIFLSNLLIQMYGACSSIRDALALFHSMPARNPFSWRQILLSCLASSTDLSRALSILARTPQLDVVSSTAAVAAAARAGDLDLAESIFDGIRFPSVISWNTMLAAYDQFGRIRELEDLFDRIPEREIVSWIILLSANTQEGNFARARLVFDRMPQWSVVAWNAALSSSMRSGDLNSTIALFHATPERNLITWSTLLGAYSQYGHHRLKDAMAVFRAMPLYDVVTWTILLDVCFASSADEANRYFHAMPARNLVTWNTMLGGYSRLGDARKTARLLQLMPERDILSWTALLTAHAYGRNISECRRIFSEMPYHDTASEAAMLGAYALAGNLEDAQRFFAGMGVRNVVAWTCLVGAYARAGRNRGALDVFRTMVLDGIRPNEISLCCVLLGCSHGGMVSDGWDCFRSMAGDHGLRPLKEHYGCLVDLLSRAGHLQDAQDLVWNMPFIPDEVEWTSLLGGCKLHKDSTRGSEAAKSGVSLNPECASLYSLLANICSDDQEKDYSGYNKDGKGK